MTRIFCENFVSRFGTESFVVELALLYEMKIHEVIRIPDGSSIQVLSEPQYHEKLLPCLIFEFEN